MSWDVELGWVDTVGAVLDGNVGAGNTCQHWHFFLPLSRYQNSQVDLALLGLARDELLPRLSALSDDVHGILAVLALARERELVLWLAVGNLVDAEPLIARAEETREMTLNILDVVQARSKRVVDVDDNDLPVGLALVEQSHDSQNLDLLDLTGLGDQLADLTDIQRVVVSLLLGLWVGNVGVFPGLRESTVVPEVALVREAVADEAELALLGVLLDWVELLVLGDLAKDECQLFVLSMFHNLNAVSCCLPRAAMRTIAVRRTSCLALVQRGISTTMFNTVCCSLAYSGMSWKGETGTPSFSM